MLKNYFVDQINKQQQKNIWLSLNVVGHQMDNNQYKFNTCSLINKY